MHCIVNTYTYIIDHFVFMSHFNMKSSEVELAYKVAESGDTQ